MKRKLVKQGAATMMVSLPSKWIKENGLDKGSEVDVDVIESGLLIAPSSNEKKSEIKIELPEGPESAITSIVNIAYRLGYDKIWLNFKSDKHVRAVLDLVKDKLIGMEVTKREKHVIMIESVTEPNESQYENILRKMFLEIHALSELTIQRLKNKNEDESEDFEEIEDRFFKYNSFCRRVLVKNTLSKRKFGLTWTLLVMLSHSQREMYRLNKIINKKIKVSNETISLLEELSDMFKIVEKATYDKKIETIAEIHKKEKDIILNRGYSLISKKTGQENVVLYHILAATRYLYLSNSPLYGLIL